MSFIWIDIFFKNSPPNDQYFNVFHAESVLWMTVMFEEFSCFIVGVMVIFYTDDFNRL